MALEGHKDSLWQSGYPHEKCYFTSRHSNIVRPVVPFLVSITPDRFKSKVVDVFQIHARWQEEVMLVKREMANFLKWYLEMCIPSNLKSVEELEREIKEEGRCNKRNIFIIVIIVLTRSRKVETAARGC